MRPEISAAISTVVAMISIVLSLVDSLRCCLPGTYWVSMVSMDLRQSPEANEEGHARNTCHLDPGSKTV